MTTDEILSREGYISMCVHDEKVRIQNNLYINLLKEILTPDQYEGLNDYLKEFNEDSFYAIKSFVQKNEVVGKEQEEDYWFKKIFIYQRSVGESGDNYEGTVWIPITDELFLSVDYEC